MLCVKFLPKMALCDRVKFYSKRHLLWVKFLPKKPPMIGAYIPHLEYLCAKFSHKRPMLCVKFAPKRTLQIKR